jgi:hypothetical protein
LHLLGGNKTKLIFRLNERVKWRLNMKSKIILAFVAFALLLPLAMPLVKAETTLIRINPENTEKLSIGDTFTVTVEVENCVNVKAVQIDIHYDSDVLEAIELTEGPFLPAFGEIFAVRKDAKVVENYDADTSYGRIYYVVTLLGDAPVANGNGVLFTVTFKIISDGSSVLKFVEYQAGSGVSYGTYFQGPVPKVDNEIIPELHDAYYGPPDPISNTPDYPEVKPQGLDITSMILPLMILPAAVVFFFARKRASKQN